MRDRTVGDTFYMFFTTRAFATGIPTVLAGTPVVSAYEDSSTTQITAGITLGVDHDGVVGLNLLTIVATGANGYETGKDYSMVITTGTVGGVSVVGEVVGEFSLDLSAALKAVDLLNDVAATDIVSAGAITTSSGAVSTVTTCTTTTTNTDMRGTDNAGTAAELAKVPKSDSTVTWNSTALASINAECDTALTDYDGPTNTELNARTLLAADYFDPAADTVANVTTVATTTTNTDMRGTDSALLASSAPTNFSDLSISVTTGLVDITQTGADKVWSTAARTITAATNITSDASAINTTSGVVDTVNIVNTTTTNTDAITVSDVLTTQMTEAYAADGVAPTLAQAIFAIQQWLQERSTAATTVTVKKIDGSTSAMTFTLDDATTPTSITRAT